MVVDARLEAIAKAFAKTPGVTFGKLFASMGLKANGKIFAMVVKGKLVVKLPKSRVDERVSAKAGTHFEPGPGRVMKEARAPKSRMKLLAGARAPSQVSRLEDKNTPAGPSQEAGCREAAGPRSDHDGVGSSRCHYDPALGSRARSPRVQSRMSARVFSVVPLSTVFCSIRLLAVRPATLKRSVSASASFTFPHTTA